MKLDRVTITGPDDSISPEQLIPLSAEFPFVEWGILVSANHTLDGGPRFPSTPWIRALHEVAANHPALKLSLHVCGRWTRELLLGNVTIPEWMLEHFPRIQLNFHAERTECRSSEFFNALLSLGQRQFIFQIDGATGNKHLEAVYGENDERVVDAVPLFDVSGGAGILPAEWPKPVYMNSDVDHCYHGYAGGLGPQNLAQQIPRIATAAGSTRVWIDMETHVRSRDDARFDLEKVRQCLELSARWVVGETVAV